MLLLLAEGPWDLHVLLCCRLARQTRETTRDGQQKPPCVFDQIFGTVAMCVFFGGMRRTVKTLEGSGQPGGGA